MMKRVESNFLCCNLTKKIILGFWFVVFCLAIPFQAAQAQTLTVCPSGCDYTGIQAAIDAASNGDTISVQNGFYTEEGIEVFKNVTIVGQGILFTTIQADELPGTANDRVFRVFSGVNATFADMTIRHGSVTGEGGGLWNDGGNVTLNNVRIQDNFATLNGGGLMNDGTMVLNNSQVTQNNSDAVVAIYNTGMLTINDTLVNQSMGHAVRNFGTAVIHDSTLMDHDGDGVLNSGELAIYDTAITGNAAGVRNFGQLTIEQSSIYQNNSSGVIVGMGQAQLDGVTINDNGSAGIDAFGDAEIVVNHSVIFGHPSRGVVVSGEAKADISNTTIRNNSAQVGGAGIYISATGGALSLTNVTVSSNLTETSGGGIYVKESATPVSLTNVTLSGNIAYEHGGGLYVEPDGEVELANVTITNNTADFDETGGGSGGGVYVDFEFVGNPISIRNSGILRAKNSLIANNVDPTLLLNDGMDCVGDLISGGYNLISTLGGSGLDPACNLSGSSPNLVILDAKLGPLTANGGLTATHLPTSGSPVLDAGNPAGCTDFNAQPIVTDQRGTPRTQNGRCDIGAVEGFRIWQDLYLPFIVRN